jgi:hypothetical protein
VSVNSLATEYWFKMVLPLQPEEDEGRVYPSILKNLWLEKLGELSPAIPQVCQGFGSELRYRMKYIMNGLRVWFIPTVLYEERGDHVLREAPTQKDKWYSFDTLVLIYPPIQDESIIPGLAQFLFNRTLQEERYNDPEVQGGKIALIKVQQQSVQKPPSSLDHMHSSFLK